MSASQRRRYQPSYSSSTILLAPRRLPMRSPPPPSVGGALAALVGKPAHCRSYLAHRFSCVADYFSASVGDQWGDRAPPRTPVPPSIGTKTNVVATANRFGFSVGALRCVVAQCADRSLTCVSRLKGQAAERTAFGGSVRTLFPAVSFIGFVVAHAIAMFLHVGKCQSVCCYALISAFLIAPAGMPVGLNASFRVGGGRWKNAKRLRTAKPKFSAARVNTLISPCTLFAFGRVAYFALASENFS
jgi:hypothetical protein